MGSVDQRFERMDEEVSTSDIFEAALAAFGEGGTEGAGHDNIFFMFGKDLFPSARDVGL